MTIPGRGDLAPRRRRRHPRRWLLGAVVVVVLAGGGYVGYRHFEPHAEGHLAAVVSCPPVESAVLPPANQRRLFVRNATLRTGLAAQVARQLRQRHFRVTGIGNTRFRGHGVATVRYSADRQRVAEMVAAQIAGSTVVEVTGRRVVELDIGPKFHSLRSPAQAAAAVRSALAAPTPAPSPRCTTSAP